MRNKIADFDPTFAEVSKLSELRQKIVNYRIDSKSMSEISILLDKPEGTIKSNCNRALQLLMHIRALHSSKTS